MKGRLCITGLLLIQVLNSCVFKSPDKLPVQHQQPVAKIIDTVPPKPDTIFTIAAVGDMMLGTSYPNSSTLPADSAIHSFDAAADELQNADVTMGNLEGSLLDEGEPAEYKLHFITKGFLFRMPTAYSGIFKKAGFDALSLANNHIGDFGDKGRLSTMQMLDSVGINYGGQLAHPSAVFTVKGIRYGFCAFSPNANALPLLLNDNTRAVIQELKTRCDIVIVSFHGGGEGTAFEHVTMQMESYRGEKRGNVYEFAHNAIDAGADMVFGNGPHVNRAMELYKNRIIAYSLGNFFTYKGVNVEGICGLSSLLKININKKGEFLDGKILSYRQTHADGLFRDTTNKVAVRIKYLTETDLPQAGLTIAEDGTITALPQKVALAAVEQ